MFTGIKKSFKNQIDALWKNYRIYWEFLVYSEIRSLGDEGDTEVLKVERGKEKKKVINLLHKMFSEFIVSSLTNFIR